MIDTRRLVETPEGVDLHLTPAGIFPRAQAWMVDTLIRGVIMVVASSILALMGNTGFGVYLIVLFVLFWLYPILFEIFSGGATPGKRVMKLKVVHDDGTPVGWSASVVRNLLRVVDILPSVYAAGFISMLVSRDFRRLGDLAAGTLVIHAGGQVPEAATHKAPPQPPPLPLTPAERRAIVDFAERVPLLTGERAAEIASHVSALTGGPGRTRKLQSYAAWIVGRR